MEIDYKNTRTINIAKEWTGTLENGTEFTIEGGWNDWDGYYVEAINLNDFEGDDEEIIKQIEKKFLDEINS